MARGIKAGDAYYEIRADLSRLLDDLKSANTKLPQAMQDGIAKVDQQFEKLSDGVKQDFTEAINTVNKTVDKVDVQLEGLGERQKSRTASFIQGWQNISFQASLAGAAMTAALGLSAKSAADFQEQLALIESLGVKNMDAVEEGIKRVSTAFGKDMTDSAKAAYDIVSTIGPDGAASVKVLELATEAATAGVASVTSAAKMGTGVMQAFGLSVDDMGKIFDQSFIAVADGVVTFEELASSVGQASSTFAAAGLSTGELFASVAALTKVGIPASEAVTAVNMAINDILKPTHEAKKLAAELGIEFNAQALASKGLEGVLKDVAQATGGSVEKFNILFGSITGGKAALALGGQAADDFNSILEKMNNSAGATARAFDIIKEKNPKVAFQQLGSQIDVLRDKVGSSLLPVLGSLSGKAGELVGWFNRWADENKTLFGAMTLTAGAAAGLLDVIGGIGMMIGPIAQVATALSLMNVNLGASALAWKALDITLKASLVGASLAGIAWAVTSLYETWKTYRPEILANVKALADGTIGFFTSIDEKLKAFGEWLAGWVIEIGGYFAALPEKVGEYLKPFTDTIVGTFDYVSGVMSSFGQKIDYWFGSSVWIDAFAKLARESDRYFGEYEMNVTESLNGVSVSMRKHNEDIQQTTLVLRDFGAILSDVQPIVLREAHTINGMTVKAAEFGDTLRQAVDHVRAWAQAHGVASGETYKDLKAFEEWIDTHELGQKEMEAGTAELERLKQAFEQQAKSVQASKQHGQQWIDQYQQVGETANEVAAKVQHGFNEVARAGAGAQTHLDNVAVELQFLAERTGMTLDDLFEARSRYLLSELNRFRSGAEVTILSFGEWVRTLAEDYGLFWEEVRATSEAQNAALLEQQQKDMERWQAIIKGGMVEINGTIKGMTDKTGDQLDNSADDWDKWSKDVRDAVRKAQDAIKGVGGSTRTIRITSEGFAQGGITDHPLAMVGERGPELVALPVGSRVMSHNELRTLVQSFAAGGSMKGSLGMFGGPVYRDNDLDYRMAYNLHFFDDVNGQKPGQSIDYNSYDWKKRVATWFPNAPFRMFGLNVSPMDEWSEQRHIDYIRTIRGRITKEMISLANAAKSKYIASLLMSPESFVRMNPPKQMFGGDGQDFFVLSPGEKYENYYNLMLREIQAKPPGGGTGGGGTGGGGSSPWIPRIGNDLVDMGIYNLSQKGLKKAFAGGVVQALSGGGLVTVGERGPELAYLPTGTRVVGAEETKKRMGGSVTINAPLVNVARVDAGSTQDVDRLVNRVTDVFFQRLTAAGLNINGV